jgi:hypothetical protein
MSENPNFKKEESTTFLQPSYQEFKSLVESMGITGVSERERDS